MTTPIRRSIHGAGLAGFTDDDQFAAKGGFVAGGANEPSIAFPSNDIVAFFDDFLGDVVADEWNYIEGDTGHSGALQAGTNGVYRLQGSSTAAAAPGSVFGLNRGALNWKADQGPGGAVKRLHLTCRLKPEVVNRTAKRLSMFVGFTDTVAAEMPIYDTGAGVQSAATDAVGFMLGARADTGWSLVAVDTDVDATPVASGVAPVSNTYSTLEVVVLHNPATSETVAKFYIDGKGVGQIVNPITETVALTPVVAVMQEDTGGRYVDVDFLGVSAKRDTGL